MAESATIVCPHCHHQTMEVMPETACLHFFECPACHTMIRPKPGDCCVFCSHSDQLCPPRRFSSRQ